MARHAAGQWALPQRAYRARRGQATHPQGKPVDGLCEVRACDHRSPTTAYGLTRFACRAAVFVGVDAMQCNARQEQTLRFRLRDRCACRLPRRPSASSCGAWARALGAEPRRERCGQTTRPRSRLTSLSADDGDEVGHAVRVAAPALAHRDPQDATSRSRRRSCGIAVIPAHTRHLGHESPGLRWIQDVGHGAYGWSDDV